jgi:L-malate glycosyltransferase
MNILHLASTARWTGVADPVLSLAKEQSRQGHSVCVGCTPGRSFEKAIRRTNVPFCEGVRLNVRLNPLDVLSDYRLIQRFCRENAIDVVHCHLDNDHWLAALALGNKKAGRPLLVRTLHGKKGPHADFIHRWLFAKRTDGIICLSNQLARLAEEKLRIASGSVAVAYGAADLEAFCPQDGTELRDHLNIPLDAPVIGVVSRLREDRGLDWLLQAFPRVLEKVPNARLFIVGRGEQWKEIRAEIQQPQYRNQVLSPGYFKAYREGIPKIKCLQSAYAAMDATLFVALGSEGTCRAILEAMACGKPTVGADIGAVSEIITEGKTGFVVPERSAEALAEKMVELLSDRARCAEMGAAARQRAEAYFTQASRANAVEAAYAAIAGK